MAEQRTARVADIKDPGAALVWDIDRKAAKKLGDESWSVALTAHGNWVRCGVNVVT